MRGSPLHYYLARESNIDIDIVRMLVDAYRESLTTADDELGFTPLHTLLCSPNIADLCDALQFLIEMESDSLQAPFRMTGGVKCPFTLALSNTIPIQE